MSLNWTNLRTWNGSQQSGFEELCCQLAAAEEVPQGSRFIRKGAPDAGVECYWTLPGDVEWGWQAKFFLSTPGPVQWKQLDESVCTALRKHPKLTRYILCLPLDRQDPRIADQSWFMDEWNKHSAKWVKWAAECGSMVEFIYWGESEVFSRLSLAEHRGRLWFWFGGEFFSQAWFKRKLDTAIKDCGERYTPEVNVKLPVAELFEGLGWTLPFFQRFKLLQGKIERAYQRAQSWPSDITPPNELRCLDEPMTSLLRFMRDVDPENPDRLDLAQLPGLLGAVREPAWRYFYIARDLEDEARGPGKVGAKPGGTPDISRTIGFLRQGASELVSEMSQLATLINGAGFSLASVPALLLRGEAGSGKSHLLCDVAKRRVEQNIPTLLLLGQHFIEEHPWQQITRLLGLTCGTDEFLGALNAAGEASRRRAVLMIDALNEGSARSAWRKALAGMIEELQHYPWIAIVITVRTSYVGQIIPSSLNEDRLVCETHYGFSEHEYDAAATFFKAYGIKAPSVPMLASEFRNPLFLKLFCRGLKNLGLTTVPRGLQGISKVFNLLVDSVNEKLALEDHLNFDPNQPLVRKALHALAVAMVDKGQRWLSRDIASDIVGAVFPSQVGGFEQSLFRMLITEGLLAEDHFWNGSSGTVEGIRFTYDRFSDHTIATLLLDRVPAEDLVSALSPSGSIGVFLKDERSCSRNRGVVEALSIQIPERVGKELVEFTPHVAGFDSVIESFVESLVWRKPECTTDATRSFIQQFARRKGIRHLLLNAFLTVASEPDHPFNADFLDSCLRQIRMPDRDMWWSVFLHGQHQSQGAVDRLIEWAWSPGDKSHIDDESIRLTATALAWFLTTSDRFVRDSATKALVSLLTSRIHVLNGLITHFWSTDDLYVRERLLAVAYGAVMRTAETKSVSTLATTVYLLVFKDGNPVPHVLLRDYARGVIELALHRNISFDGDISKARPPYRSEWPTELPSKDELQSRLSLQEESQIGDRAAKDLYSSVMEFEDFARYIIGTNGHSNYWTTRRLADSPVPWRKERVSQFLSSLSESQKQKWELYSQSREGAEKYRRLDIEERLKISAQEFTEGELKDWVASAQDTFTQSLRKKKRSIFRDTVLPHMKDPTSDDFDFDLRLAQRFVLSRVLDMGWTAERFGEFDATVNTGGLNYRSAHKSERIGKKYQWLAWHEFLARMADNFYYRENPWDAPMYCYQGPWQSSARDIDPSCLLRGRAGEDIVEGPTSWWHPVSSDSWNAIADDLEWLNDEQNLPEVASLLAVTHPIKGTEWLILNGHLQWDELILPEGDPGVSTRQVWYRVCSCVVHKSDAGRLAEWAVQRGNNYPHFLEDHPNQKIFLGEYAWAPAYRHYDTSYYCRGGWQSNTETSIEVLQPMDVYSAEGQGFDCSLTAGYEIKLPVKWLMDRMHLSFRGVDGQYFDAAGELIAYDPSVERGGSGVLLVRRDRLLAFLDRQGCELVWVVTGEKHFTRPGAQQRELGWLNISYVARFVNGDLRVDRNCTRTVPPD